MLTSTEFFRWSCSFVAVAAVHLGAVALALHHWTLERAASEQETAAVLLELAPLPAAPEIIAIDAPLGPDLSEVLPDPEPPPPLDLAPLEAVKLPVREPHPEPTPRPPVPPKPLERKPERKPPSQQSAPKAMPEAAPVASAPLAGATPEPQSAALPSWKGVLLRHLERYKRYPAESQRARQEGVTYVHFTMSRDGRVLDARIQRAAGIALLDREGLELLQRAQPLPPLPPDQPGETLALVVPIQFSLRR